MEPHVFMWFSLPVISRKQSVMLMHHKMIWGIFSCFQFEFVVWFGSMENISVNIFVHKAIFFSEDIWVNSQNWGNSALFRNWGHFLGFSFLLPQCSLKVIWEHSDIKVSFYHKK